MDNKHTDAKVKEQCFGGDHYHCLPSWCSYCNFAAMVMYYCKSVCHHKGGSTGELKGYNVKCGKPQGESCDLFDFVEKIMRPQIWDRWNNPDKAEAEAMMCGEHKYIKSTETVQ